MNRLLLIGVVLLCPGTVRSEDKADGFAEIEKEIETQLSSDDWHPASRAFIRTQWAEYQQAHRKPGQRGNFHGAPCYGGIVCGSEIKDVRQFAGAYRFKPSSEDEPPAKPFLQIVVSPEGRVFVIEENRRIRAVVNNNIIFYTTGTLLEQKPQLGSKPYAQLEMTMIYKAQHFGWVMGPADAFVDDMLKLEKAEK